MFCPSCRTEYVEGVTECADCGVKLVASLPPEPGPEYTDLVTVFTTTDQSKLMVAKSLLEGSHIKYFAKGEAISDLFSAGRIGFNPITGAVELQVLPRDEKRALLAREGMEG